MSAVGVRELPGVAVWRRRVVRLLTYLGLAVIAIVMLYPFWSMGIASFRSLEQYQLGHGFSLTSWRQLFHTLPVGHQLLSSTIVTVGAIALILAVSATAGYALGVLRYRFSTVLFLLRLFLAQTLFHPFEGLTLAEWLDVLRRERFRVDPACWPKALYGKIFLRMMLPLALPAIFTVTVLQFIQIWDDLLVGLLFLQTPNLRPITVGLATIPSQHLLDVPVLMAGSLMSALPAIVVYLVFQRYLITGLTMGMSK